MTQIFDLFGLWDDADFPGEKWVKSEEYFWNWRIIVTYYSGLQIRKEKVEHFFTADCKSAGTPSGSTYRAQQYLRHRRIENRRPKGKPNLRGFLQRPNRSKICVIGDICVAFFKDRTGRKSASSAISAWLSSKTEQVENLCISVNWKSAAEGKAKSVGHKK